MTKRCTVVYCQRHPEEHAVGDEGCSVTPDSPVLFEDIAKAG